MCTGGKLSIAVDLCSHYYLCHTTLDIIPIVGHCFQHIIFREHGKLDTTTIAHRMLIVSHPCIYIMQLGPLPNVLHRMRLLHGTRTL